MMDVKFSPMEWKTTTTVPVGETWVLLERSRLPGADANKSADRVVRLSDIREFLATGGETGFPERFMVVFYGQREAPLIADRVAFLASAEEAVRMMVEKKPCVS